MAELIVQTFTSLDGVMQAPGGPDEDTSGGFTHGGWSHGYWDEAMGEVVDRWFRSAGAFLLGRTTYEIFAAHWPNVPEEDTVSRALNTLPKYVASTTLTAPSWANTTVLDGDVVARIADLKVGLDGELQVHGSAGLIRTLTANDLVDEYRVLTFPVVLGTGKRLFESGAAPAGLEVVESATSSTGVIIARYRRAGDIKYGSFALE